MLGISIFFFKLTTWIYSPFYHEPPGENPRFLFKFWHIPWNYHDGFLRKVIMHSGDMYIQSINYGAAYKKSITSIQNRIPPLQAKLMSSDKAKQACPDEYFTLRHTKLYQRKVLGEFIKIKLKLKLKFIKKMYMADIPIYIQIYISSKAGASCEKNV